MLIPCSNSRKDEVRYRNSPITRNDYFRRVFDKKPEIVDIIEIFFEPWVIEKYNIFPNNLWCSHYDCRTNGITAEIFIDEIINRKYIYFCKKRENPLNEYFAKYPHLRNVTAQILRDPNTKSSWFSRYTAFAEYEILKKEFENFNDPHIKIIELDKIFTQHAERLRKRYPEIIGETKLEKIPVIGFEDDAYAYIYNDNIHYVGFRYSKLWPKPIHDIMKKIIRNRFEDKTPLENIKDACKEIGKTGAEDFIIETILTREPEEYKNINRLEVKVKQAAGFAYDRLKRNGVIEGNNEDRKYVRCFITKEERKKLSDLKQRNEFLDSEHRIRLVEDPDFNSSKIDEFYYVNFIDSLVERTTGKSISNSLGQTMIDSYL